MTNEFDCDLSLEDSPSLRLKIGSRVKTQHGAGEIVGKDLPESKFWRWIVRIDTPNEIHAEAVNRFPNKQLCYFKGELELI